MTVLIHLRFLFRLSQRRDYVRTTEFQTQMLMGHIAYAHATIRFLQIRLLLQQMAAV
jgi:hypothetical protein